jgi:hypothetical protein
MFSKKTLEKHQKMECEEVRLEKENEQKLRKGDVKTNKTTGSAEDSTRARFSTGQSYSPGFDSNFFVLVFFLVALVLHAREQFGFKLLRVGNLCQKWQDSGTDPRHVLWRRDAECGLHHVVAVLITQQREQLLVRTREELDDGGTLFGCAQVPQALLHHVRRVLVASEPLEIPAKKCDDGGFVGVVVSVVEQVLDDVIGIGVDGERHQVATNLVKESFSLRFAASVEHALSADATLLRAADRQKLTHQEVPNRLDGGVLVREVDEELKHPSGMQIAGGERKEECLIPAKASHHNGGGVAYFDEQEEGLHHVARVVVVGERRNGWN